jgi:hypothetical protein
VGLIMPRIEHRNLDGTVTVTDTRTLAEAQAEAAARIEAEYAAQIAIGAEYGDKPLQIDPASTANMTAVAAQISAAVPLPAGFAWRMADNTFLPVTPEQMIALAAAASARVMALRKAMWAAKDAARAAETNDAADAIRATWP